MVRRRKLKHWDRTHEIVSTVASQQRMSIILLLLIPIA